MRKTNNRIDSFGPVCFWPISSHRVNFLGQSVLVFSCWLCVWCSFHHIYPAVLSDTCDLSDISWHLQTIGTHDRLLLFINQHSWLAFGGGSLTQFWCQPFLDTHSRFRFWMVNSVVYVDSSDVQFSVSEIFLGFYSPEIQDWEVPTPPLQDFEQ